MVLPDSMGHRDNARLGHHPTPTGDANTFRTIDSGSLSRIGSAPHHSEHPDGEERPSGDGL
ncbi:hypothetical protein Msi02_21210 [Microbispora siamensis]|uniref:Uncharacterized protein n=1 Tax=Microbispora siamensis TaxID=564413 RepID=A0ABQ4GIW6_9ACTN|nr:hypothetical protein Msi02_21210 [Microbispora siamensis]